jgi:hypothetical protein
MGIGWLVGLVMIGIALLMFVVSMPRHGQVVGFLRDRDNAQAFYVMLMILLLAVGGTVALTSQ